MKARRTLFFSGSTDGAFTVFKMYYVSSRCFVHTPHEIPTIASPKRTSQQRTFGDEAAIHADALRGLCERFQVSARFNRSVALACEATVRAPPSICATS